MGRQCERPDCAARASVAYGFDAGRRTAWFADLTVSADRAATTGALCAAHARAMVLPRGWWLDDRREAHSSTLFTPPASTEGGSRPAGRTTAEPARRSKRRARTTASSDVQLPLDTEPAASTTIKARSEGPATTAVAELAASAPDEPDDREAAGIEPDDADHAAVPWRPRFDQTDDLGGLLAARTPLLARAFGGRRRSAAQTPGDDSR